MKSPTAEQLSAAAQNALDALESIGVEVIPKGPPPDSEGWFRARDLPNMATDKAKRKLDEAVRDGKMEMKKFKVERSITSYYRSVKCKRATT